MRMCRYFSFDIQKILKTNSLCKLWNNIEFKVCIFALDYIYIYEFILRNYKNGYYLRILRKLKHEGQVDWI